jgi:hypothetical protein
MHQMLKAGPYFIKKGQIANPEAVDFSYLISFWAKYKREAFMISKM